MQRRSRQLNTAGVALVSLALSLCLSSPLKAQVIGATLAGTVSDPSGAVIAGAQIAIKNMGTGEVRTVTTDSTGLYSAPNLEPASYDLTVSTPGFSTLVESGITLTVGAQQVLNITLQVGQTTQVLQVAAEPNTVELATSAVSAEVNGTTVRELPLNGRDWTQLATLQLGVTAVRAQATSTIGNSGPRGNRGFGNMLSDDGHRPYENSYRINGINNNDYSNGAPGSVIGANLGVDAIQEFSVLTTNYTAEYGRTSGAVINAVMKSGTNDFHGTAFGFFRDKVLDARNFFDASNLPGRLPPFHRAQYGASAGGPILRDKTFIFGDYEGIDERVSSTKVDKVPSNAALSGTLCSVPTGVTPNCTPTTIQVSPLVTPYLGLWRRQNAGTLGNGDVGVYDTSSAIRVSENYATVKVDHHISENDSLSGSYLFDTSHQLSTDSFAFGLYQIVVYRDLASLEETHIFSPTLVNTVRLGYNRSIGNLNIPVMPLTPIAGNLALGFPSGTYPVAISVTGLTLGAGFGHAGGGSPYHHILNSWQLYDDAFKTQGSHSLKFGFAFERLDTKDQQFLSDFRINGGGQISYNSVGNLLQGLAGTGATVAIPGNIIRNPIEPRASIIGGYLQDDWRARPNLTLNLGLRYEMMPLMTENHNALQNLLNFDTGIPVPVQHETSSNPTLHNFSPRVGFAWDPFHNGKTSVRAGFGIYDQLPLPFIFAFRQESGYPFNVTGAGIGCTFVDVTPAQPLPTIMNGLLNTCQPSISISQARVAFVDRNPHRSYAMDWNLSIQRQITPTLTATIGYSGSHAVHLPYQTDNSNEVYPTTINSAGYFWPVPVGSGTLHNPNVNHITALFWGADSHYHSLQAELRKSLRHGFQGQASYTWGKCLDNGSSGHIPDAYQNSNVNPFLFDQQMRKGPCDFNIAQNFTLNFIWVIPAPKFASSAVSQVVGGWEVGGIFTASTGVPFTPLMDADALGTKSGTADGFPDRLAGCNPINGNFKNDPSVLQYINLACFQPPTEPASFASLCSPVASFTPPSGMIPCLNRAGNAGRNRVTGPGLRDLDFSVFKNNKIARISENFNVQFRAEFFNILNRANFQAPIDNNIFFDQLGAPVAGAGQIDATTTTSRQIQLGIKIVW